MKKESLKYPQQSSNSRNRDCDFQSQSRGWFKAMRGEAPLQLLRANKHAFVLAFVIAHRARWSDGFNYQQLELGEAMLGDHKEYDMSEQEYRTAKIQLQKWGFATFRPTNKGTIGKLVDTRLFEVSRSNGNEQTNTRLTDSQRTANGQLTDS